MAIGSSLWDLASEMQRVIGPATRVMDLRGRGVTPGFIDAHTHTEHTAEFLRFWVNVHSQPLPSTRAIMDTVRERVMTVPSGTWVIGQGTFGQPMPSPDELTGAFPDHPVVLRWSRHDYVVNKKALEVSGITRATPIPRAAASSVDPTASRPGGSRNRSTC